MSQPVKKLSEGEKMIWAAAYALELRHSTSYANTPKHLFKPAAYNGGEYDEWYKGQVHTACEIAAGAVIDSRKVHDSLEEGYFSDSDVTLFHHQMHKE